MKGQPSTFAISQIALCHFRDMPVATPSFRCMSKRFVNRDAFWCRFFMIMIRLKANS